jgi:hypothetical protein
MALSDPRAAAAAMVVRVQAMQEQLGELWHTPAGASDDAYHSSTCVPASRSKATQASVSRRDDQAIWTA